MLRWAIQATALASILAALAAAEGCGSSSNSAGPDASTGDGATDGGAGDVAVEAEAGPDCGSTPPTGTQLAASTDPLVVFRLTSDHAVYEDLTTQELYAVPLAGGGMPSDIGKMTSQASTLWSSGAALLYLPTPADPNSAIGPLSSWSPTSGTSVIAKSAIAWDSYEYTYDVSKDGQYVAYYATTTDSTATLIVSTIDGKTQTSLVSGIDLQDQDERTGEVDCYPPVLQFVNDTILAQYCTKPSPTADAGTPSETMTIAAFAGPSFTTPAILGTTFQPFSQQTGAALGVDPSGMFVLMGDDAGNGLYLYPLAGGTPTTVDAKGTAALFAPNGDILYTNTTNALIRYAASSGTMTTLVASGLTIPFDLSADGNWLQAAYLQSSTTGLADLFIAPAMTAGTANEVLNTETGSALGFTADSNYSVFGTGFPTGFAPLSYDLQSSKTSGGAATKVLTASAIPLYPGGSKVVTNTNLDKTTGGADIVELDLSTTASPTVLVSQADPNLFLTTTNQVVYSWYCDENATAGVWTLTPP
jgi:hypothetical protein